MRSTARQGRPGRQSVYAAAPGTSAHAERVEVFQIEDFLIVRVLAIVRQTSAFVAFLVRLRALSLSALLPRLYSGGGV